MKMQVRQKRETFPDQQKGDKYIGRRELTDSDGPPRKIQPS